MQEISEFTRIECHRRKALSSRSVVFRLTWATLIIAMSCNSPAADLGLEDLNTHIVLSIEGRPVPEQMIRKTDNPEKQDKKSKSSENNFTLNWAPEPLSVKVNEVFRLRAEIILANGAVVDITNSPYLRLTTSATYKAHISRERMLIIRADPNWQPLEGVPAITTINVEAEYVTPQGALGFTGFRIDISYGR